MPSLITELYTDFKNLLLKENIRKQIREQKRLGRNFLRLDNSKLTNEDLEEIITIISEEFPDIETLGIAQNNLDKLPDSLASLTSLIKLNLSLNNFTDIPKSILGLPNLEEVYLYENPLSLKFLFEISSEAYSHISFTFHNSDRNFLQKKQKESSNAFRNVALFLAELYPNIDYKRISTLFNRLNNYQKEIIEAFKYSLSDVGVSFEDGSFSNELNLADTQMPLFIQLLEKAYKIEDVTEMNFLEAVNLVKTKPEYLQGIIDFGLTVEQMDRLTSKDRDFLKGVYETLAETIQKEHYSDNEDEFNLGELTAQDKALARTTVDTIIKQHNLDEIVIREVEKIEAIAVPPNTTQKILLRRRKKRDKQATGSKKKEAVTLKP